MNILLQYPPEILNLVFSYLSTDDIRLLGDNEPILAPFYRVCKYRKLVIGAYSSLDDWGGKTGPPVVNAQQLPLFMEINKAWFLPQSVDLQFVNANDLLYVPIEYLNQFKCIEYTPRYIKIPIREYEKISHVDNIRTLALQFNGWGSAEVIERFPLYLEHLHIRYIPISLELPPQLRELSMAGGSFASLTLLPPKLKKLMISELYNLDYDIRLPRTLVELEWLTIPHPIDFLYLTELETLRINCLLDGFKLPSSLTTLQCHGSAAVTELHMLENLTSVTLNATSGKCSFPPGLRYLEYTESMLSDLRFLESLTHLESLKLFHCQITSTLVLDIAYPKQLQMINFDRLIATVVKDGEELETGILKFSKLPPNLELFSISMDYMGAPHGHHHQKILIDSSIVWPNSIKLLVIDTFGGFYKHNSEDHSCVDGIVWPLELQTLRLPDMGLKQIRNTNLGQLQSLQKLVLDHEVEVMDPIPKAAQPNDELYMRIDELPVNLQSQLSHIYFDRVNFTLSNELFKLVPSLTKLEVLHCAIEIPAIVEVSKSVREIQIHQSQLTSEQWNNIDCPECLEVLSLRGNLLCSFDFATVNEYMQQLHLWGNPLRASVLSQLSQWDRICEMIPLLEVDDWKVHSYFYVPEIGGEYRIIKEGRIHRDVEIIDIVMTLDKVVVYNGFRTFQLEL